MQQQANVVWFKRDLRLSDHAPLSEAARIGSIVPLYIVESEYWQLPDTSRRHWHFLHDCLDQLKDDLAIRGCPLNIVVGDAIQVFEFLLQKLGNFNLWSHEETGNLWTYKRDIALRKWCLERSITWREYPANGVVRRLKDRDLWSDLRNSRMAEPTLPTPNTICAHAPILFAEIPSKNDPLFGKTDIGTVQTGGQAAASKTLQSFLNDRVRSYMQTISKPGISARYCSRLSAHIAYGTLSVREIEQATKFKIKSLESISDPEAIYFTRNLQAFLSRIAWRCHFVQKLEQQPSIEYQCMHTTFDGLRENSFRDDFFEAWKLGLTGYPLVDACMRSLRENGWITFRMRALLVSFASYNLWLDWRKTAPYLAGLFTDYEPGIHYAQMQMQSGVTGINAVRIYNPIKQSKDHDPEGKFIRRYVPELKDVPDSFIHEPWLMHEICTSYPTPLVDHDISMRFARSEISKCWHQDGFKDESERIRRRLGSRTKRSVHKKKKPKTKPVIQQRLLFEEQE